MSGTATRPLGRWDLPPHLTSLYDQYSWSPWTDAPAFAYDDTRAWAGITDHVIERASSAISRLSDSRLVAQEKEMLDKMAVCWRLTGYGELYEPDPSAFTTRNADQAKLLAPYFKQRRKQYFAWFDRVGAEYLRDVYNAAPVRMDKGKGAPYWAPSSDRAVALAYGRIAQGCATFAQLEQRIQAAGNAKLRFVQTSYIRVQGARKVRTEWINTLEGLKPGGERVMPKVRRIGAMPFSVNHLMAGVGAILRDAMANIDSRHHGDVDAAADAVASRRYNAALDFASFDTTVALETLEMVDRELLFPCLDYLGGMGIVSPRERQLLADCAYHINYMSILLPPRNHDEAAYLVTAEGQTRSGIQLTSWYGTEVNGRFIEAKLNALGCTLNETVQAFNYGDDTIIATDDSTIIDRWAADPHFGGFNTTVAPDATFLMKRLPTKYSYLGRMLAASINREPQHEPRSTIAAASAFATRHALLQGHPLQGAYLDSLGSWDRAPERMSRAVAMAKEWRGREVDLTNLAMAHTLATNPVANTESLEQQINQLVGLGAKGAIEAREAIAAVLIHHKRAMPWAVFQAAAAEIPLREAERMVKERSYTIPRFR